MLSSTNEFETLSWSSSKSEEFSRSSSRFLISFCKYIMCSLSFYLISDMLYNSCWASSCLPKTYCKSMSFFVNTTSKDFRWVLTLDYSSFYYYFNCSCCRFITSVIDFISSSERCKSSLYRVCQECYCSCIFIWKSAWRIAFSDSYFLIFRSRSLIPFRICSSIRSLSALER